MPSSSGAPPPRARTTWRWPSREARAADSRWRKWASPLLGEDLRDGAAVAGFDLVVEVEEVPAEALGEERAGGGFAGAHEAGEDDAVEDRALRGGIGWWRVWVWWACPGWVRAALLYSLSSPWVFR